MPAQNTKIDIEIKESTNSSFELSKQFNMWQRFALTTAYITRLPIAKLPTDYINQKLNGLSKYLPAVGILIGTILFSITWLLYKLHAPQLIMGAAITISWLLITGGIHFDGLMDAADGIFSHRDQKRMLEIMTDSRVGNFGAMTGFCVLIIKFATLSSISFPALAWILIVIPAWARFCETYAIGAFHYLRESGMGKIWHDTTKFPGDILLASVFPLLVTIALQYFCSFKLIAISTCATIFSGLAIAYLINEVLKGHTGDTYGSVVELAEAGGLLIVALIVK